MAVTPELFLYEKEIETRDFFCRQMSRILSTQHVKNVHVLKIIGTRSTLVLKITRQ